MKLKALFSASLLSATLAFCVENTDDESLQKIAEKEQFLQNITKYYGTLISASPYPGVRATYEGSNLMSQLSEVNQDLQLLIQNRNIEKFLDEHHISSSKYPKIFFSGSLEASTFIDKDPSGKPQSDINLANAELDIYAKVQNWVNAFVTLEYDSDVIARTNSRVANSNFYLKTAYLFFGCFNTSPFYLTAGQYFVPFGQYSTYNAFSNPLTKILFRTLDRSISLGVYSDHLFATAFASKGLSFTGSGNNINTYGVNIGSSFDIKKLNVKLALGAIRNVANSLGMQLAFANPNNNERLQHVVPGIDVNGFFTYGDWRVIVEYISALRSFAVQDVGFSTDGVSFVGAKPSALNAELAYVFELAKHPSKASFGYSFSRESLAFDVPKTRITTSFGTYIFSKTLLSLEYRYDKLYDALNRASGNLVTNPDGSIPYYRNPSFLGHGSHALTLDVYMYW